MLSSVCSDVQMICIWSSWCHCHPIISCVVKIQTGSTFLAPTYPGPPGKRLLNRCLCLSSVVHYICIPQTSWKSASNFFESFLSQTTTITTITTILWPFVQDYLGEPVQEETFTHPPSWSSSNLYQRLPPTTIHSVIPVQLMCLTIFLHNLSPSPLWSTSCSGALHLILHTFLHPISVFFSQHMPIPLQPVLL